MSKKLFEVHGTNTTWISEVYEAETSDEAVELFNSDHFLDDGDTEATDVFEVPFEDMDDYLEDEQP